MRHKADCKVVCKVLDSHRNNACVTQGHVGVVCVLLVNVCVCVCVCVQEGSLDVGSMSKTPPNRRGISFEVGAQLEARDNLKNW